MLLMLNLIEIQSLTSSNFTDFTTNQTTLLKFFSPYCNHCIKATSEIKKLAKLENNPQIQIAEIDCSENLYLCQEQLVSGYPTIMLVHQNQFIKYDGQMSSKSIQKWVNEKIK